jgi:hypothetical protein
MSLRKQAVIDRIDSNWKSVLFRYRDCHTNREDGNVISQSYHRHTIAPGQDYSNECDKVKAICQAAHTAEVIAAYQAMQEANRLPEGE